MSDIVANGAKALLDADKYWDGEGGLESWIDESEAVISAVFTDIFAEGMLATLECGAVKPGVTIESLKQDAAEVIRERLRRHLGGDTNTKLN